MTKRVRLETWKSNENQEEIHFFAEGTPTYVFGFNPKYLSMHQAYIILGVLGFEVIE